MSVKFIILFIAGVVLMLSGCKPKSNPEGEDSEKALDARTPVTITTITTGPISDSIVLNATTSFLKKNILKSSATGYIEKVNAKVGDEVSPGEVLFTIKTKEASAFTSKMLDTILSFNGKFDIKAATGGILSEVDKHEEDYVNDGEQLCIIAQKSSLVFLLNVPYEYNRHVQTGLACSIELPDKTRMSGVIESKLSAMDVASQTESFIVRASGDMNLPENLIAKIKILKTNKANAISLPVDAVLTDETQQNFWVMKLINDSTAVKVPVVKGLESGGRVEITSPKFNTTDKILLSGNYGLADTAFVKIESADTRAKNQEPR
jgi:biotin carboxyl carrier protein